MLASSSMTGGRLFFGSCAPKPEILLINWIISPFSIVPDPSLSNARNYLSNSSSLKPLSLDMSARVSWTKSLVSCLSR